ncbi:hypothetical protein imdm_233 [gamma proteobacterium IMCC2047]|nr:hypothetical protein imdm_233 [gamma proteobacterium IMCC2047]
MKVFSMGLPIICYRLLETRDYRNDQQCKLESGLFGAL